jgi:hypothetical protein
MWRGPALIEVEWGSRPRNASSKKPASASFILIITLIALAPCAFAQRTSVTPAHTAARHFPAPGNRARAAHFASRRSSPYGPGYASLPFPFLSDNFNPDDIYSTGFPVAAQPPAFLMQAMQQLAGAGAGSMGGAINAPAPHQSSSNDPLMIELQNGRYVRVNNAAINGDAEPLNLATTRRPETSSHAPLAASSQPHPPAVLVFRDGHREEVRDYTIANNTLYARGDFYTDGYWTKQINLATLDLAQTQQANSTRNVPFTLPTSPNEVITRF